MLLKTLVKRMKLLVVVPAFVMQNLRTKTTKLTPMSNVVRLPALVVVAANSL